MTTEGSTENESRYRYLIESILRERLLFRNPGRFGPSNKKVRHQDVSDLDVSVPKKSEIRHTYTNLNGSKHANIVHVIEIHVCNSNHPFIHPSCVETFWCRNVVVSKHQGVFRGLVSNRLDAEMSGGPGLGQKSLVTKTT